MERARLSNTLSLDLRALRDQIDGALASLEAKNRLNPHLIANSVMLTEQIAQWNLVRDLLPMVQGDEA
jgi:hypothetical protein